MKFLVTLLLAVPAAIIVVALSVANRHDVTVLLDPTTTVEAGSPLAFTVPVWMLLFGVLALGVVIGGISAWASQHRYRAEARTKRREANHWHRQADEEHERAERLAARDAQAANEAGSGGRVRRPLPALAAPGA